jgi:hypothetical protein
VTPFVDAALLDGDTEKKQISNLVAVDRFKKKVATKSFPRRPLKSVRDTKGKLMSRLQVHPRHDGSGGLGNAEVEG